MKDIKFHLLKKKPTYLRLDVIPIPFSAFIIHHFFGEAVFDQEHILAISTVILAISFHVLVLLLNFWSVNANVFFGYKKL